MFSVINGNRSRSFEFLVHGSRGMMMMVRRCQWTFFAGDDRTGGREIRAGQGGRQERGGRRSDDRRRCRRRNEGQGRRRSWRGEFVLNGLGRGVASGSQRHSVSARWCSIGVVVRRRRRARRGRSQGKLIDQLRETFVAEIKRGR